MIQEAMAESATVALPLQEVLGPPQGKLERQLAAAQQTVTAGLRIVEMIAGDVELEQVLSELIGYVEAHTPAVCSVLLLAPDGRTLRHAAAPRLPAAFVRAIDGAAIGPRAGSCGTAAYHGRQVIVSDIASDPLWEGYRELALPHGLRACWATPIVTGASQVLGTFAL